MVRQSGKKLKIQLAAVRLALDLKAAKLAAVQ